MDAIFFPRNDYPNNIEICNHRLGKKMTLCETTTMIPYLVSKVLLPYIVELNRTYNIRVGAFFDDINNGNINAPTSSYLGDNVMQAIDDNIIYPELYFLSDSGSGDYSDAAQEESKQHLWNWFSNKFGRIPPAIMFGLMPQSYGNYMMQYVLGADINDTNNDTDYGIGVGSPNNVPYSQSYYFHRYWNRRALDGSLNDENYSTRIANLAALIDNTLALPNGGFIFNFNHWHNLLYKDYERYPDANGNPVPIAGRNDYAIENGFKPYFNMLAQKNANDEIYFSGYGEAIGYLVYRESISKAVMYSPVGKEDSELVIRLEALNVFNIDTDLLQTPISIKFSTIGTPLAGKSIRSDNNMIDLGNNQYIIEIPWSKYPGAVITDKNL